MSSINTLGPNTPRIALIGECMIELQQRADGTLQQSFGGDTLNTAVYLSRELGKGAEVDYVTALGDDSFSDAMCQSWASEGIGLEMVQRLPGRLPGLYCIQTDAAGERRFSLLAQRSGGARLLYHAGRRADSGGAAGLRRVVFQRHHPGGTR